jgi:hypothetical protein
MKQTLLSFSLLLLGAAAAMASDVTGKWTGMLSTPNGDMEMTITLKAEGEKLTGTVGSMMGEQQISDGKIDGDKLSWVTVMSRDGNDMKLINKATVAGKEMKVSIAREGREDRTFEFTAKKAD